MSSQTDKERILIVDDQPNIIWPLSQHLQSIFKVQCSTTGEEALEVAFSEKRPDVILIDIMMPGMNGYQLFEKLKADDRTRNIPIIFMSGKTADPEQIKALDLGAQDYIIKPFSLRVVAARIRNALNVKREMDRRQLLKTQLENLNQQLERDVRQRQRDLEIAHQALKRAEVARISAEEANATKSDFLARMSHEIRTPLNAVTGLTNFVLKSELTSEQRDYLNKVQIASENLLTVVNDILDFSKVEAGRLELEQHPFELGKVLEHLADLFNNQVAQKDIELVFAVSRQVPRRVTGDAVRLTQVLTNLVDNAVKFTQRGGKIIVRVESDGQAEKMAGATDLKFSVSDTGMGIGADVLPTLFEPFAQADSYLTHKHEGAGLGLAICRRLVELMGGRIWGESTPGKGSTFSFYVRLETGEKDNGRAEDVVTCRVPEPAARQNPRLFGRRVLVVEDIDLNRELVVAVLKEEGLLVEVAENGQMAVEKVTASPVGYFDAVLMDIQMPVMDGYEATGKIREFEGRQGTTSERQESKTPVIALTAHALKGEKEKCLAADMDDYLAKPLNEHELRRVLLKWITLREQ